MRRIKSMQRYTIKEVANLSGLPESTLRYYETIGLIQPIYRDKNSKHRVYTEADVTFAEIISCLNATGMSIDDMRKYFENRNRGALAADEQITLLQSHKKRLLHEERYIKLRQQYVNSKIAYWEAMKNGDATQAKTIQEDAKTVSKELQLFRSLSKQ